MGISKANRRRVIMYGMLGAGILHWFLAGSTAKADLENVNSFRDLLLRADNLTRIGADEVFEKFWLPKLLGIEFEGVDQSKVEENCMRELMTPQIWDLDTCEVRSINVIGNFRNVDLDSHGWNQGVYNVQGGEGKFCFQFSAGPAIDGTVLVNYRICCSFIDEDGLSRLAISNLLAYKDSSADWKISEISRTTILKK